MLSIEELRDDVAAGMIDTVIVGFTDLYGRLMGKRFDARFFVEQAAHAGTHVCDYLFTVNMAMEPGAGYAFAGWEKGYGDVHLEPDLSTLRRAGWTERSALVLCDVADHQHTAVAIAPRNVLHGQIDRLTDHGLYARVASELEFYLLDETYRQAHQRGYAGLSPTGWYSEDYDLLHGAQHEPYLRAARRMLVESGVPVESSKGETGIGQHELNISHGPLLEMADRHVVAKHAMKELAATMGQSVTFMAKPFGHDAGSSCHVHLSLWDVESDTNVFVGEAGQPSEMFRWFLGGWMRYVDDFMTCYAPTINSYKRYVDGSWAPTRVAWATDNRTVGFRVVGAGPTLRIECRLPGADANPYLLYAAVVASGIAGIEQRIEPPDEYVGDGYQNNAGPRVAASLAEATNNFASSSAVVDAFGPGVVEHYSRFFGVEVEEYRQAVTDWERWRYYERI